MSGRTLIAVALALLLGAAVSPGQDDTAVRARTVTFPDGSYSETVTDPKEHTMRVTTYDESGKPISKVLHKLDADLEPIESFTYDPSGKPLYRTELKHDAAGNVSEALDYTPQNKLIRRIVYTYDSLGKLAGVKTYDPNGREVPTPKKRAP